MTAYLIVRADVPEADRDAFDRWYATEHLRDAKAATGCLSAQRGWSLDAPGVHIALYAFPDVETATAAMASDAVADLIAEFDRVWRGRVMRSREVFAAAQTL